MNNSNAWGWEEIIPLDNETEDITKIKFPIDVLPCNLGAYISNISNSACADVNLIAPLALSALSLACKGSARIKVSKNGFAEPLNVYALSVAPPGSSKTYIFETLLSPFIDYAFKYNQSIENEIISYNDKKKLIETRIDKLQKSAKKDNTDDILNQIQDLRNELSNETEPHRIKFYTGNATIEAIQKDMYRYDGKYGIFTDEGEIFKILSGKYSNGVTDTGIIKEAWSNKRHITIDRAGSKNLEIDNLNMAIGILAQQSILDKVVSNDEFSSDGFTQRFLFSTGERPERQYNVPPINQSIKCIYNNLIKKLIEMDKPQYAEVPTLLLTPKAEQYQERYLNSVEKSLKNGKLSYNDMVSTWGNKFYGNVMRIAGILHIVECLESINQINPITTQINDEIMSKSIEIGNYFLKHSIYQLNRLSALDKQSDQINKFFENLKKMFINGKSINDKFELTTNIISKNLHINAKNVREQLEELEKHHYIKTEPIKTKTGKPSKTNSIITINPMLR